jgi:rhodanese-related sulfurtransferase
VPLITPSPTPAGGAPTKARVPRISVEVAKQMADAGEAVLVDVRTNATFGIAHIAGAISFPSDEIPDHYDQLPTDRLIIFYCA